MTTPRVFVLCPDHDAPSGGIRKLYRHVDVLASHDISAFVHHKRPGFRCSWFANTTPIVYAGAANVTLADYVVVPEIYGLKLPSLFPGIRKVIFNQNTY